ncbi:helix-turn-helix transcriptional regulator [Actinomadura sp. WMMB 499]|uniref:helix-turn-helix domain-containing protein n=1 Tax=Actinomadura sp. WMMB 499 TaxID=1219491 RepID=UPI0012490B12|nr:helix-turn-helix transcriptional regulator [Actinomadura sp. WMMB 499]QFG24759.1 helix-turn-helix transcriptional regulator [Actinomadura sp. WMMB 499]
MARADHLDPDSSHWHWLAVDLRVWRLERNLSQAELGALLGVDISTVSNWESGSAKLPKGRAEALDRIWKTRGHFARLRNLAESSHNPDWFDQYTRYERKAEAIRAYSALALHGLLQTEEYTRALVLSGELVDDVDQAVEERMARQQVLAAPRPPELWILIKESVLQDPIGGPDVMRVQLDHLINLSHRPNIVIRVVPRSLGAHPGIDGSFTLLECDGVDHSWSEAVGGGRLVSDPTKVRACRVKYDRIGADALSRDCSRNLIAEVMEAMQ